MNQLRTLCGSKQTASLMPTYWSVIGSAEANSHANTFSIDRQPETPGVREGDGYA